MKIYLDLVVILNFLVDFLLLLGTNRLSGFPASPLRAAAAAALGAVYSGVCMMPRMRFLGGLLWRIVSLAGMAVIAGTKAHGSEAVCSCFSVWRWAARR